MMIEIKKVIRPIIDNYSEELERLQEKIAILRVEYCKKDDKGKAVIARRYSRDEDGGLIITEEQYVGLVRGEQPEFDAKLKSLNEAIKSLGNADVKHNNKEKSIEERLAEIKPIKRSKVPTDWNGLREEIFWDFIEENRKKEATK